MWTKVEVSKDAWMNFTFCRHCDEEVSGLQTPCCKYPKHTGNLYDFGKVVVACTYGEILSGQNECNN